MAAAKNRSATTLKRPTEAPLACGLMASSNPDRLAALDGLRALAITGVVLTHVLPDRVPGGQIGVDIFFALSGYLITGLLLREHDRFGRISLRAFYARRALRLVPAFTVFLIGATALAIHYGDPHAWGDLASAATYTWDIRFAVIGVRGSFTGHSWSLSVEEQFYLLWPVVLIALLARRPSRTFLPVALLAVGFLAFTAALQLAGASNSTLFFLPTTRLPELLTGALGAIVMRSGLPRAVSRPTALTPVAGFALLGIILWMRHHTWSDPWSYRGGFTAVAMLTVVVILHAEQRPASVVTRLLGLRPVALVGRRSYAAYLWHVPALIVAQHLVTNRRALLAITIGPTAIAATVSWHVVEKPCLRFKRRFERVHLHDADPGAPLPGVVVPG
jgi:peptidoglycan/LPS O-acetylase OafA/YrhL